MSHSIPRRIRNGASSSFAAAISSALAAHVVGVEPRHDSHVPRVVADREVLVAEPARRVAHLQHGRPAVRPVRVHVQVASDVRELDELRRLTAKRRLTQLRRTERDPERAVDALLVRPVRKRPERLDVLGRAGRPQELGPEAPRLRDDDLDRNALDRHPDRAPRSPLDDRDDLRQLLESLEHRRGPRSGAHDREHLARVAPTPRVARDLAAERPGDVLAQRERTIEKKPAAGSRPFTARESGEELRLRLRPDPGHLPQAPFRRSRAELVHGPHSERARDLRRPLGTEPEQPTEPDELRRDLALQRVQLREPSRLDELAQPRLDPGPDPAQVAHTPGADELGNRRRRLANRLRRAAVRTRRVRARPLDVEQPGERLEPVGDLRVRERHAP